ncbi:MAG TPA: ABC transporter substrate-binding protein [Pseudonocardia sp.]|nr:ABC transporter substrate-binding protein [Pseudonocardia sp.]
MESRRIAALSAGIALLITAGCGQAGSSTAAPAPAATGPLTGVCPDPVVVQTDWFAEAEYGAYFQLLGGQPTFDTDRKRVTAPLVADGQPTGVDLEIRYGGPAIGFQQVSAQLYADPSITMGLISTDESIQNSARLPTLAVVAPLEISPLMLMWDRAKHSDVATVADLNRDAVPVLYYQTDTYMQYLLGSGLLAPEQVDGSYDGSPSRWVAADGTLAQGGFATAEPYIYRSELGDGRGYDVNLQLIHDTGYPSYGQALSIRTADREQLAPCLRQLVPMVQRAQIDYITTPARTNALLVQAVAADNGSVWSYSPGLADFAVGAMRERGIVGNGPNATLGDMDPARVARMIEILTPIFAAQNAAVPAGLAPGALVTNEFVDPSIGLPPA